METFTPAQSVPSSGGLAHDAESQCLLLECLQPRILDTPVRESGPGTQERRMAPLQVSVPNSACQLSRTPSSSHHREYRRPHHLHCRVHAGSLIQATLNHSRNHRNVQDRARKPFTDCAFYQLFSMSLSLQKIF